MISVTFKNIFINHIVRYPTHYNLNYNWSYGSLAGIFYSIQILTGLVLASHYISYDFIVFENLEHIMRDVDFGWLFRYLHLNGASFFFIVLYLHLFRGIFYKSYIRPRQFIWFSGVLLLLISILTAFIGYVLPWGQMSFWGATVITNSVTAVPYFGNKIVLWLWGNFTVSGVTLVRFFNFHYLMAIVLGILIFIHLILLHEVGSSNPIGFNSNHNEKVKFLSYFYLKDLYVLTCFLFLFFIFVFYFPNLLGHHYNYIRANPLVTPTHIVPEWYSLPFYAILRSFDNKLVGVIAMVLSIFSLFLLPLIEWKTIVKSMWLLSYFERFSFYFFMFTILCLWWIGSLPATEPYIIFGKIFTFFYFFYFVLVYISTKYNSFIFMEYHGFMSKIEKKKKNLQIMTLFLFDIIEQFDINVLLGLIKENPYYIVENIIIETLMFMVFYFFVTKRKFGFYSIFFLGFSAILTKNVGEKFTNNYLFYSTNLSFFYFLFLFISYQNLVGLVPDTYTVTALIILPAHVSFTFFIAAFGVGVVNSGIQFPKSFVPFGIPPLIAPFLAIIEFISYFIRLFSLSVRLFINLLAGHLLFKIFSINLFELTGVIWYNVGPGFLAMTVITLYTYLEIAAAILQAIVLTSLTAIYLNESAGLIKNPIDMSTIK